MGVVYKARQKHLDRLVALKILSPAIGQDPAFAERFQREARAMAMLSHPHIVTVHDFGRTEVASGQWSVVSESPLPPGEGQGEGRSLYFFLMEFVDGVNLRRLLDTGKLSPEEALAIVPQICDALQYAHDAGVVHRDIKPENILLDKHGRVKIADFGLAKLMGRKVVSGQWSVGSEEEADQKLATSHSPLATDLTATGQIMGTPQYMAPEQIEHPTEVDHRADIYSLGVVFYQMLTGELPIGRFAPPSKKVQIDVRLDEVVLRALEKEPDRRYQQASELKTRVETIVTTPAAAAALGRSGTPVPDTGITPPGPGATRGRATASEERRSLLGIPLAERRHGVPQIISWPGLLKAFVAFVVFGFGGMLLVSLAFPKPIEEAQAIIAAILSLVVTVIGCVWIARKLLRGSSGATGGSPASAQDHASGATAGLSSSASDTGSQAAPGTHEQIPKEAAAIEQARQQVRGPAIGLLVAGMISVFTIPMALLFWSIDLVPQSEVQRHAAMSTAEKCLEGLPAIAALFASFLPGILMIVAAVKMKRLQAYWLAILASILAIASFPVSCFLINLPIGIWALVVLSQRDVRNAFGRVVRPPVSSGQRKLGIAALLLCLASPPLFILFCCSVPYGSLSLHFMFVLPALEAVALILGILGRRSFAGKFTVVLISIVFLIVGPFLLLRWMSQVRRDFGGQPSVESSLPHWFAKPAGPILLYEVDSPRASLEEASKASSAARRRVGEGPEKLAEVMPLAGSPADRRVMVTLYGRSEADRERVERLLASPGNLEFHVLADTRRDQAIVDQAQKEPDKTDVLDASGKKVAWWVPVKPATGRHLLNGDITNIVHRTRPADTGEAGQVLILADPYNLTGAYLVRTWVQTRVNPYRQCLELKFCDAGGQLLAKLTGEHLPDKATGIDSKLGILLDGQVLAAPLIVAALSDNVELTDSPSHEELSDLVRILNAGPLPYPLYLIQVLPPGTAPASIPEPEAGPLPHRLHLLQVFPPGTVPPPTPEPAEGNRGGRESNESATPSPATGQAANSQPGTPVPENSVPPPDDVTHGTTDLPPSAAVAEGTLLPIAAIIAIAIIAAIIAIVVAILIIGFLIARSARPAAKPTAAANRSGATGSASAGSGATAGLSSSASDTGSQAARGAQDAVAIDEARLAVQGPAIGLLVLGILELMVVTAALAVVAYMAATFQSRSMGIPSG